MNLYLVDVVTKSKILEVLAHAEDAGAARSHVASKFPRCELQNLRPLEDVRKHFVVAETDGQAEGMSMRDYFAAAAMAGGCVYAKDAYKIADAMLAER